MNATIFLDDHLYTLAFLSPLDQAICLVLSDLRGFLRNQGLTAGGIRKALARRGVKVSSAVVRNSAVRLVASGHVERNGQSFRKAGR